MADKPMTIQIERTLINRILSHAQHDADAEVCGLIGARNGVPQQVYPVRNTATDPARLFAMAPQEQIAALRAMRENGEELFAIYHSHPHAPAAPSTIDLAEAAYPEALYLIVSLDTKGVLELRGYRLHKQTVEPVELEMM